MKIDVVLRLDDEPVLRAEGLQLGDDNHVRLDKGITVRQVREAADDGGTARFTVVVRKSD